MRLNVRNLRGNVVRTVDVRDDVFGVAMNRTLVHQVVVGQLANARQGTAATKTRAQASGGGAKPRPQKGTGASRQGSIRSPLWRGGGRAFGPHPRSYRHKTTRRAKRGAFKAVLSDKAGNGLLIVVENLELSEVKTREMAAVLERLDAEDRVLLVADGADSQVLRATRNIPSVKMLPAVLLNTLDVLRARKIVMTLEALRKVEETWAGPFIRHKKPEAVAHAETEEAA